MEVSCNNFEVNVENEKKDRKTNTNLRSRKNDLEQDLIDFVNIHNKYNKIVYWWYLTEKK